MTFAIVLPAAGEGKRLGQSERKAWAPLNGKSVLDTTLDAIATTPGLVQIVIAVHPDDVERCREHVSSRLEPPIEVVAGGIRRQDSVLNGLRAVSTDVEWVGVHDAARPWVTETLILRVLKAAREFGAAIPGVLPTNTIKQVDPDGQIRQSLPRNQLRAVQTPQFGRRDDLIRAISGVDTDITDEAEALERAGIPVTVVEGDPDNRKVTYPADLTS
jgi:2-C-methyl-D-erythritol 4-phosphate cytidylyltransferase